jgi:hypothetical protein
VEVEQEGEVDMIPSRNVTNLGYVYLSCVARTVWVVTVVFAKHLWTGIIYRHHDTIFLGWNKTGCRCHAFLPFAFVYLMS